LPGVPAAGAGAAVTEPAALSFMVAFVAGLLSFLSPCVLPLVPSYVGFITGMTLPEVSGRRRAALLHALLFVAGFSLVFVLLGASATALGRALNYYQVWLQRVGGVLIIIFGFLCLGVFKVGVLNQERRVQLDRKPVGYLGSALVGVAFGAGWTPCIGPVLGAILGLAATTSDVTRGMQLLAVYSAGLALPFLAAAVAVESFLDWFQSFRRYLPWVMRLSGLILIVVGVLLVTGEFTRLAGWLQGLTPEFLKERL
jgi:cytochrome c-type biogenesis protein